MNLFTIDRLILLCLIAILGLAIIASHNRMGEGYESKNTTWAEYMKMIDPIVKQINYFSGKNIKLINTKTQQECSDTYLSQDCKYIAQTGTNNVPVYQGKLISETKSTEFLDRLTKSEIVSERLKKTESEIKTEIDSVLNDLIGIVGKEIYDEEIPKLTQPPVETNNSERKYNPNITDVTYHESAEDIRARDKTIVVPVKDASGNVVNLPWDQAVATTPRYNESSYFRFSPSPYVPNYEDSIHLSRLTQYNDKNTQVVDYGSNLPPPAGGFCVAHKHNNIELENQCGKIGKDACASTSCCVLLGGTKCVAGNESGPTMKSNYSDISVLNRDYYYYQGKCYGNCP